MEKPHSLRVASHSEDHLRALSNEFIKQALLVSRVKTWEVLTQIRTSLVAGMNEDDARRHALNIFKDYGVTRHWHRPYIRFGPGTVRSYHEPIQLDAPLREGDPIFIDVGPVWKDTDRDIECEGDAGDSFVFGNKPNIEAEQCISACRKLFLETQYKWASDQLTGAKIYEFLSKRADELGYLLMSQVDGHLVSDFPHQKYTSERLASFHSVPADTLWVLEVQIRSRTLQIGAFYEDILCK